MKTYKITGAYDHIRVKQSEIIANDILDLVETLYPRYSFSFKAIRELEYDLEKFGVAYFNDYVIRVVE